MTDSTRKPDHTDASIEAGAVRNAGRRRLLKSGLATAPVVLTLSSRPVLAWHCRSPSAVGSGNASNPGQQYSDEGTKTCAEWASCHDYPGDYSWSNTCFNHVFASPCSTDKFKTILNARGRTFEKYMIAACLNIANTENVRSCLTLAELKQMWVGRNGTYCPVAGVYWDQDKIIAYLKGNWIVPD